MLADLLIKKLQKRDALSEKEQQVLHDSIARVRVVEADSDIASLGQRTTESCLLLDGFAARYRALSDGRRQITEFHVPGDFVDLHSFLLHTMDHGVVALSPSRIAVVPHSALRVITETLPHLTRLLWLSTLIDGAVHREWLVGMGRMQALGQAAHVLCELYTRLEAVGLVTNDSFKFPVTQAEWGDALGLSTVHANRTIQELRNQKLIAWRGDTVTILDWDRLCRIAEFDPTYLHYEREPR